jgi:L-histidine N-alpha-methyltransferase
MERSSASPPARADRGQFAEDVAYYLQLTPRQLPSRYLYDDLGSALFEAICRLPWYPIARAERELLHLHAHEIFARVNDVSTLVELGPGNGDKLVTLLGTDGRGPMTTHLVDVSQHALEGATRALSGYADLAVIAHRATYEVGLAEAARERRVSGRALVLFLGSNIGNFDPPGVSAFLKGIRAAVTPGDALLLGVDLVKPAGELLLAYDDPLGVTSAFNRNLLVRANRELGADFDLDGFTHRAVWTGEHARMEMHLVSARPQHVHVPAARLHIQFEAGETIWTESSYKYQRADVQTMLARAGFAVLDQWTTDGFALTLAGAT